MKYRIMSRYQFFYDDKLASVQLESLNDKVFHRHGISCAFIFSFGFGKNKRFVCITEGLGEHDHDYCDFDVGSVYSQLIGSNLGVGQ